MKRIITSLIVLFAFSVVHSQNVCNLKIVFAMNKSLPPSYTFRTESQIEGAKYLWSFGDNTKSESATPTHSFQLTSDYVIFVKVTDLNGKVCSAEMKGKFEGSTNLVPPVNPILTGKGVVKNMSSIGGCGLMIGLNNGVMLNPVQIVPNFLLKEGQNLEISYEILKNIETVCMNGITVKIHKISEIIVPVACKVPVTFTKNAGTPVSYTFKTDAQPEGSKYFWQFGDGGTSETASPTYTFKKSGTYPVILKVVDLSGKVCYGEIKASFAGETNPVLTSRGKVIKLTAADCNLGIALENNALLIPAQIVPAFELKEGQIIEFTYEKYLEKVTTCKEGIDAKILTVKELVNTECKAMFTASNQLWSNAAMMKKVVFANLSVGAIETCLWNFGDNTTSTELKPTHEYAEFGEYNVCLSITTKAGCKSEYCAKVKVQGLPVSTTCKFDIIVKPKADKPNTYLFSTASQSEIKSWEWNFGDDKTSTGKNPEHTYEKTGTYSIGCTITTSTGCTETRTIKYTVLAAPLPNCQGAINITLYDPTENNCNGKAVVKLLDANGAEITGAKFTWSDGRNGNTADKLCPNKAYTVQAIVEGVCQKSYSFNFLAKPLWNATNVNGTNNFSVIAPVEGVEYVWDFGNGQLVSGSDVIFSFESDGIYEVKLKAASGEQYSEFAQEVLVMNSITSVKSLEKTNIEIYPNPVKGMMRINLGSPVEDNLLVEVLNISGQKVYSQILKKANTSEISISLDQLKSGMYLLRISNDQKLIRNQKFIKAD